MAHAFTTKRKTQRWHMVIFFNMLDLVSIASRVVFMLKFPLSPLPHEDNRQVQPGHRAITCSSPDHDHLLFPRSCVVLLSLHFKSLSDKTTPTFSIPSSLHLSQHKSIQPRKEKQITHPLKTEKMSLLSVEKRQQQKKKTTKNKKKKKTSTCSTCARHICQEHSVLTCPHCSS